MKRPSTTTKEAKMAKETLSVYGGKYTFVWEDGDLSCLRHGEPWVERFESGSNAVLQLFCAALEMWQLLDDISFDFDPDKTKGPPCGPEMLKRIQALDVKALVSRSERKKDE